MKRRAKRDGRSARGEATTLPVLNAEQAHIDPVRFPDLADLMAHLRFSTADGRIWFNGQRMLLLHARALGLLRHELIESIGIEAARGLLSRMGYHAGTYDAQVARRVRAGNSLKNMFFVGPQMHCLEGVGLSEPVRLEFDIERGEHYGEFVWTHQVEDEEHMRHFPLGSEPACWMQVGYASGYSSEFMGRPILYREVECQSMGQATCRIVGKPVEQWDAQAARDFLYLSPGAARERLGGAELNPGASLARLPAMTAATGAPQEAGSRAVGMSPGFNSVLHMVRRVAPTNATVLFLGESGVGKEVFARLLHGLSGRESRPFVAVNCAALPEQLVEAELFGAERGAFTGAHQSRAGRFERAHGGTLFLDEIGTLSLGAQGNLLRALQEGEIERLGDSQTRRVDVRVVAATNVDLREEVRLGRFREDLFFRLNVFPIRITPLRERHEDIPLLLMHFLARFNRLHGRQLSGFTQRAVDAMMAYPWPGNVRELENVVERGVILADDRNVIDLAQLFTAGEQTEVEHFSPDRHGNLVLADEPPGTQPVLDEATQRISETVNALLLGDGGFSAQASLDEVETLLLKKALEHAQGNAAAAARLLGITRPQMVYRMKSRGITHLDQPE